LKKGVHRENDNDYRKKHLLRNGKAIFGSFKYKPDRIDIFKILKSIENG
jgi:hypothetical protein